MAYEEIADHLLNSSMGDVLETMVEFNYPNFTNLLYKFVADVVESSSKFPYDPAIYRGMYVFEARPVSRDHIAITFNV
jgi:hypothetical protein